MTQVSTDPAIVEQVWKWCQEAYRSHGRGISFPKGTDRTKTYQWRYATRLANQLAEWGFDDSTAKYFINMAVSHAKERKLLRKGLAALFQSNLLETCYEQVNDHFEANVDRLELLRRSHGLVTRKSRGRSHLDTLLACDEYDDRPNIVDWYQLGKVTALYIVLSRSCAQALAKLNDSDFRDLLPSKSELFSIRMDVSDDIDLRNKSKSILGQEWRTPCL